MNRQVPEKIAIVGNGKVAKHMIHYFESVGQPYIHWFRQTTDSTQTAGLSRLARFKQKLFTTRDTHGGNFISVLGPVQKVLLLLPDDQIEPFIQSHPELKSRTCIHCSGSLQSELAIGCHPLMTFGPDLYELDCYKKIPFVVDEGADFSQLFPLLSNPSYSIKSEHKATYHALCVMAGNFSQMLWRAVNEQLPELGLPDHVMNLYLAQNTTNFIVNPQAAATGPLVRGDQLTIGKHIKALQTNPLADIYQAFLDLHQSPATQPQRKSS
ncbi:DUF2520 domain-containing protein [Marinicella sp. S1101]|uniref:DUF2520 domain-containing protein n=1 Tax=Marinicella marina TaxID=2996016 RepID=UPI0022609D70|nr:DUF2520 domain-containing protein [Marinicella marina]MCX7552687.1 DUF2520 domain-containing protein [Marinicella marina]MDJ1139563.1 DUF2520 domain-containing protein [Marinicella marina]